MFRCKSDAQRIGIMRGGQAAYPVELLNQQINRVPPHCLKLKLGRLVMLLQHMTAFRLTNDTRMVFKQTLPTLIGCESHRFRCQGWIHLPCITLEPPEDALPFKMKGR